VRVASLHDRWCLFPAPVELIAGESRTRASSRSRAGLTHSRSVASGRTSRRAGAWGLLTLVLLGFFGLFVAVALRLIGVLPLKRQGAAGLASVRSTHREVGCVASRQARCPPLGSGRRRMSRERDDQRV